MVVRLSASRAGRPLPPGRFLVLLEAGSTPRIRSIERCNDLIGNRTRDRPACSIVPQPATLPRAGINLWQTVQSVHIVVQHCIVFILLCAEAYHVEQGQDLQIHDQLYPFCT
jgi:hypothetical protein